MRYWGIILGMLTTMLLHGQECPQTPDCDYGFASYASDGSCDQDCVPIYDGNFGLLRIPLKTYLLGPNLQFTEAQLTQHLQDVNQFFQSSAGMHLSFYIKETVVEPHNDFSGFCAPGGDCSCPDGGNDFLALEDSLSTDQNVIHLFLSDSLIVDDPDSTCGQAWGLAAFPLGDPPPTALGSNTLIIRQEVILQNYWAVTAHELGHVLGLFHTFDEAFTGSCSNPPCYTQDGILDTPPDDDSVNTQTTNLMDYNEEQTNPLTDPFVTLTDCQEAKIYQVLFNCRSNLCSSPGPPDVRNQSGLSVNALNYQDGQVLDTLFSFLIDSLRTHDSHIANWYCFNADNGFSVELNTDSFDLNLLVTNGIIDGPGNYTIQVRDKGVFNPNCVSDPVLVTLAITDCNENNICEPNESVENCVDCQFSSQPNSTINTLEYFFDIDPGIGNGIPISADPNQTSIANLNIDISSLTDGVHVLYLRARDDEGAWSLLQQHIFLKEPGLSNTQPSLNYAEYFINNDPGLGNATSLSFTPTDSLDVSLNIPIDTLIDGVHTLFVRVQDEEKNWSKLQSHTFVKASVGQEDLPNIQYIEYFIDNDPGLGNAASLSFTPSDSLDLSLNIPIDTLIDGVHTLYIRAQDEQENWSQIQTHTFIKTSIAQSGLSPIQYIEYFIDADPGLGNGTPISLIPNDSLDLVVALITNMLTAGNHTVYFRARDTLGRWSFIGAHSFNLLNDVLSLSENSLSYSGTNCQGDSTFLITLQNLADTVLNWQVQELENIPSWVTLSASIGSIPALDSLQLNVAVRSDSLATGSYTYPIQFTNTLSAEIDTLLATLQQSGTAEKTVAQASLNFGTIAPGSSNTLPLNIQNGGCEVLEVTSIQTTDPNYVPATNSLSISPYDQLDLSVSFVPTEAGFYTGDLILVSNDGNDTLALTGISCQTAPTTYQYDQSCAKEDVGIDTLSLSSQYGCDSASFVITSWQLPISNDGLQLFYPFDGTTDDLSGFGHHVLRNEGNYTSDRFGQTDQAFLLDGANDWLDGNIALEALQNLASFSISTWFKTTDVPNQNQRNILISANYFQNSPENIFRVGTATNGGIYVSPTNQSNNVLGAGYNDGQYHHLVLKLSTNDHTLEVYVDNELVDSMNNFVVNWNLADRFSIGQEYDEDYPTDFFSGVVDDFLLFNRELSTQEIIQLYLENRSSTTALLPQDTFIEFGQLTSGDSLTLTTYITNTSCDTLSFNNIYTTYPAFSPMVTAGQLEPYESLPIPIQFVADSAILYIANLVLESDSDTISLTLQGLGCITQPSLQYELGTHLCSGDTINISTDLGTPINWNTGFFGDTLTVSEAGTFFAIYSNGNGCILYTDSVDILEVPDVSITINGASTLCVGDAVQLVAENANAYNWSTGATSPSITVQPLEDTYYSLSATNSEGCSYVDSVLIQVIDPAPPAVVTNMIPADGATGISNSIIFSWLPGPAASTFDLYIWKSSEPKPAAPTHADLQQIILNHTGLELGESYTWQVHSKNSCQETLGPQQTFDTRFLPDLIVQNVQVPSSAFSGQTVSISWEVINQGQGSTGSISWIDKIYFSEDNVLHPNIDLLLSAAFNISALNSGEGYTNTVTFKLPEGVSGSYFVFISVDPGHKVDETDDTNNINDFGAYIPIQLTPPPDLIVASALSPTNSFSGQTIALQFEVHNQGAGPTIAINWTDQIYLSTSPYWSPSAQLLKTIPHQGNLVSEEGYMVLDSVVLPDNLQGPHYLHFQTDAQEEVYEFIADNNNTYSVPINIFLTPPADLQITAISASGQVSNNELVEVSWTVTNNGANSTLADLWEDRIYLSTLDTFNLDSSILLGTRFRNGRLLVGESYIASYPIRIPKTLNGPYHWYVQTDASDLETEFSELNNTSLTQTTQIQSPDLAALEISSTPNAFSGQSLIVGWMIKNLGPGEVQQRSFTDSVGISTAAAFHPDSMIWLEAQTFAGSLAVDSIAQQEVVLQLPDGLSGTFYTYVKCDAKQEIFEVGMEANNIVRSDSTISISLNNYPDLHIDTLIIGDSLQAGETISYEYIVTNLGPGSTQGQYWSDRLYLSTVDTFTPNTSVLATLKYALELDSVSSYVGAGNYTIPRGLPEGLYYPYAVADFREELFEIPIESNNNVFAGDPVYIQAHPFSDLQVDTAYITAGTLSTGQEISTRWKVRNNGPGITTGQPWTDAIYLSKDGIWDSSDLFLGQKIKEAPLLSDSMYWQTATLTFPNDSIGDYYVLVVCDYEGKNTDDDLANNQYQLGASTNDPLTISLSPPVDLQVVDIDVPSTVVAGQPLKVVWSVRNEGVGSINNLQWQDYFYLTPGPSLSNSTSLTGTLQMDTLLAGETYTDSITLSIPLHLSGNLYLAIRTDRNNQVYEHLQEDNNIAYSLISIEEPSPVDLSVQNIMASVDSIIAGDTITVSWQLHNLGANEAVGTLSEAVYFSRDPFWDLEDPLLALEEIAIQITPLGAQERQLRFPVNMIDVGPFYIIVRTDLKNNFLEAVEDNNTATGNQVVIAVEVLPLNELVAVSVLNNVPLYRQIPIPDSLFGETLLFQVLPEQDEGINIPYISFGQVPTRTVYDVTSNTPYLAEQSISVPDLRAGRYFSALYGTSFVTTLQHIQLMASIQPFEIRQVAAQRGGNTGTATLRIRGARFEEDMTAALRNEELNIELHAFEVDYVDPTTLYASFSLDAGSYISHNQQNGIDTGFYDLKLLKLNGDSAVLANAYEVFEGSSPEIQVDVSYPDRVRSFRITTIQIAYENTSGIDVPIPRFLLASLDGTPLGATEAELRNFIGNGNAEELIAQAQNEVLVELVDPERPDNEILRAGARGIVTVYTYLRNAGSYNFKLIDLE